MVEVFHNGIYFEQKTGQSQAISLNEQWHIVWCRVYITKGIKESSSSKQELPL
jgi:hypothetical protein